MLQMDIIMSGTQLMFRSITRISSIMIRMGVMRLYTEEVPHDLSIMAGIIVTEAPDNMCVDDADIPILRGIASSELRRDSQGIFASWVR